MILSRTSSDSLSIRLRSAIFQSSHIINARSSKTNAMKTNSILSKRGKYIVNRTKHLGFANFDIYNGIYNTFTVVKGENNVLHK